MSGFQHGKFTILPDKVIFNYVFLYFYALACLRIAILRDTARRSLFMH